MIDNAEMHDINRIVVMKLENKSHILPSLKLIEVWKILNAHNLREIKAFGEILHNDRVYKRDDWVENGDEWLAANPRLWDQGFKLHKQIFIIEN